LTYGIYGSYYDTEPKVEQSKRLLTKVKALIPRVKTMNELFTTLSVEQEEALSGGLNFRARDFFLSASSTTSSLTASLSSRTTVSESIQIFQFDASEEFNENVEAAENSTSIIIEGTDLVLETNGGTV
jgi:hypothetical protein